MLRKTMWIFLSVALVFTVQSWAKTAAIGPVHDGAIAVDNPLIPEAPGPVIDQTDEVIFFDDFESGGVGWEFMDLTDVSSWHVDDYNAYGSSGLSWWAGDSTLGGYDNHWLQYLVSPTLDLSGATNPTLSFALFYAVEEPAGATPPWDGWDGCNVWVSTDDGANWDVLTMDTPAYTCQSMYSFGEEWGMGEGIAGWGGFSGGTRPGTWVDASASLTGYTTSTVKIRFALCSDPVWCTGDDPDLTGMFVDNILIAEGGNRYLMNNAEGVAVPSDLVPAPGIPPTGNFWHLSEPGTPLPPSPTHVMEMSNGAGSYIPDIFNALVSPVIDLTSYHPDSGSVLADFFIRGTINVNDPDPFPNLDNWTVQIKPLGGAYGWYYYSNPWGQPGGDNYVWTTLPDPYTLWSEYVGEPVNLSPYMGYEVQVRILFQSDPDNYFGQGLFVDDFEVVYTSSLENDVSAQKLHVPMPTSAYFDSLYCSVEVHNLGLNNQGSVPTFWRVDYGSPTPLIPWPTVPSGGMVMKEWSWQTPLVGSYFVDAFTQLTGDENLSNDTTKAGLVEITPSNVLEFGYDNRQYSWEPSIYYFNFMTGEGIYVRYTPEDDGIDFNMNGQSLKALFREPGTIRIHIYEPGTATTPGPEVTQWDASVTQVFPAWQSFDITGISFLQDTRTDFWVFYEVLNDLGEPHIYGDDEIIHGEGHFFADFGTGMQPSDYDFYVRAVFEPIVGVEEPTVTPQPAVFALYQNTPNPFNPATSITFSLEKAGAAKLSVFDLMGRTVRVLADGSYTAGVHTVSFNAGDLASGVYIYRLEADGKSIEKKMLFLK